MIPHYSLVSLVKNKSDFVDGPFGSNLKVADQTESGVRLIQVNNIGINEFRDKTKRFTSIEKFQQLQRHNTVSGDIVIAKMGEPISRACEIPDSIGEALVMADCMRLRLNEEIASKSYVLWYINSPIAKAQLKGLSKGSTRVRVNLSMMKMLQVPLPPLEEQKKIAAILDAADDLRQKNQALIQRYDDLTQALFLDMFGDISFNVKYPLGVVGDLVTHVKDGPHVSPKYENEGVPILSTRNIRPFELLSDEFKFVAQETYRELTTRFKPKKGDVLLTKGGTTGYAKLVDWNWDFCIWVHLAALRVDQSKASPKYLEAALNTYYCYQQSQRYTRGIANKDLGLTRLVKIKLPVPPIPDQIHFATTVQEIESQKVSAQQSLKKAESLFNSLIQKAFKGELTD